MLHYDYRARGNGTKHVSLSEILTRKTESGEIESQPEHIGGIIFGKGSSIVALGVDYGGKIVTDRADGFSKKVTPQDIIEGSSRVLDLSSFPDVEILQTGLETVTVRSFPSLTGESSVGVAFGINNAETHEQPPYRIGEDDILHLFAGDKGGIAVFSGWNIPEDNAFVFESEDRQTARVLFVRPKREDQPSDDDQFFFDSVTGVYELVRQLNSEFLGIASPQVTDKMRALDAAFESREIDYKNSDPLKQVYKMHFFALARLAEKEKESPYAAQLEEEFPFLQKGKRGKPVKSAKPAISAVDVLKILRTIDKSEDIPKKAALSTEVEGLTPVDSKVLASLRLDSSKELWKNIAIGMAYSRDSYQTRNFIEQLIILIYHAHNDDAFTDARTLTNALFDSNYKLIEAPYKLDLRLDWGNVL